MHAPVQQRYLEARKRYEDIQEHRAIASKFSNGL